MKSWVPEDLQGKTRSNIAVVCTGILLIAVIYYFGKIWGFVTTLVDAAMPFFIGFAIAFLLIPIVTKLETFFARVLFRRKPHPRLGRWLATIIAFLLFLALLIGFFAIIVPQLVNSIKSLVQIAAVFINSNKQTINDLLVNFKFMNLEGEQLVIAWDNILAQFTNYSSYLVNTLKAVSGGLYQVVFQFFVGLIAALYLLVDKETFCAQVKKVCYALFKRSTCETLIYWTRRGNKIFAGFITGKILDSLIIGVLCYIFMLIFRIEYSLLISVIVGLTNVIPFFGPYFGAIPSILILLLVNPLSALWFGVFIVILQQIDGNVIGPMILGDYVGLSAFWIMLSIVIGGALFGFVGMLLSVPVFALLYAIVRALLETRLKARSLPVKSEDYIQSPENLPPEADDEASDI